MVKPSLTLTVLLSTILGISPLSAQTEEMSERAIAPPGMIQTLPANTAAVLLLTTGMASVTRLYPQPRVPLLDSYNFQTAIAPVPDNRTSLAYYNLGAIVAATRAFWHSPMAEFDGTTLQEGEEQPTAPFFEFLQSLRSLSISVSIDEEREQLDIRLVLSPK